MQIQIQALMAGGVAKGAERAREKSNIGSNIKMAKPPMFNRDISRIGGFITVCRLYLRMKMKEVTVEEKIQLILSYVQGGSADIWKESLLEDLESEKV